MNTHKILVDAGWSGRPDYPHIAQFAASHEWADRESLLSAIAARFEPSSSGLLPSIRKAYPIYGIIGQDIEYGAIHQMNTAMRLEVAVNAALMPDAHQGYALPIGGVIALENAISPSFVGYDIACRMKLTILDISPRDFMAWRGEFLKIMQQVSSFGKGAGFRGGERSSHAVMDDPLWYSLPHLKALRGQAWEQLGSSGGGNHFFDAVIGTVVSKPSWMPLEVGDEFVAIMTHSGSRGTGHKLATHYVKLAKAETSAKYHGVPTGYEWLSMGSEAGQEYWDVMQLMGRYAAANHQIIHDKFLAASGTERIAEYENHHNFAWIDGDKVIHRKGATPAELDQPGIIPGSSGTPSYLVSGLGNEESLSSSSHGAGRPFSRTEAKRRHDEERVDLWMNDHNILTAGLSPDETFLAYKDIDRVMSLQTDLIVPVAKMNPKIVIMGGASDDGD